MAINTYPYYPAQVSPQDISAGQGGAAAPAPAGASSAPEETGQTQPTADQIAAHAGLVAQASQAAQSTAASGVDPTLNDESARLLALQLQQQLSGQNLSIANQAPQALLSLLR